MTALARIVVAASWVVLFAAFGVLWRRAKEGRVESRRRTSSLSLLGMVFEFAAAAVVFASWGSRPVLGSLGVAACAVLAVASIAFGIAAGVHLGSQLRLQAVVTDEHQLVTSGPYRIVRHPIYASMLGLLIATGLVSGDPRSLLIAVPMFIVGTEIRVVSEERLLKQHFGSSYDHYRRRVKAYVPGIR
jgi:protein-S-isoprenylcysteine O-methyltransferase Ste14